MLTTWLRKVEHKRWKCPPLDLTVASRAHTSRDRRRRSAPAIDVAPSCGGSEARCAHGGEGGGLRPGWKVCLGRARTTTSKWAAPGHRLQSVPGCAVLAERPACTSPSSSTGSWATPGTDPSRPSPPRRLPDPLPGPAFCLPCVGGMT